MSILIDKSNKVIVQGMTGELGTFYTSRMIDYGTLVVGGVTPEKGGTEHLGRPVFDTVRDAVDQTGADVSIIFDPAAYAADSIMEAADAGIRLCVCVTGELPAQDMIRVKRYLRSFNSARKMLLVGPGSAGIISPGKALVGIMPGYLYKQGSVGIIARSGTLGFEAAAQLEAIGTGISTSVGIGGDAITGSSFRDHLEYFEQDPETRAVILIGEIGGVQEVEAAAFYREHMSKPLIACIVGMSAPRGTRMGHAGAIIASHGESAIEKVQVLKDCGVTVVPDPSSFGETVKKVLARKGKD
jgi:malate-CoA ligase subunit alpha